MEHIDGSRNVFISGLTSAGKTTHAKLLSQEYGLQYVSASTILLKLAGLSAEQPLDFWVTPQGLQLSESMSWKEIDDECRRLESVCIDTVFDTWSMPWLCNRKGMVIWLESSLPSRIMKAHVSHRGQSSLSNQKVEENLKAKDNLARTKMLEHYSVDLFEDRTPFNLILDITDFIIAPTQAASEVSIKNAHEIISSAVGWYLYGNKQSKDRLWACLSIYDTRVVPCFPQTSLVHE
jgi:CMP/dCMP kinase